MPIQFGSDEAKKVIQADNVKTEFRDRVMPALDGKRYALNEIDPEDYAHWILQFDAADYVWILKLIRLLADDYDFGIGDEKADKAITKIMKATKHYK